MAGTLPPLFEISDEDHGGYVAVAVYTLLVLSIFIVVTRLFTRWYIGRVIHSDDILLGASAYDDISPVFMGKLDIDGGYYCMGSRIHFGFGSAMLFANSLAVELIGPMYKSELTTDCLQAALFQTIATFNIITDVALVILPCMLLRTVQLSRWKRFRIMALIASKFLVCGATGIEVHYTLKMLGSPDILWASTNATVWDQVMMNLSIMTTTLPSLGRLVVELQPDVYAFAIHDEADGTSKGGKYNISTMRKSYPARAPLSPGTSTEVTSGWRESFKDDAESMEGLVNPPNVIQQTIHFEVH
ncbi:hypothetical protein N7478_006662 [Penicillium angulare]|uniref:uncharacterized protein n=1 Tax=Penicillium angulare TaxID=116970 RepID=UPI0025419D1B|nr:uncharacterized protein N7478_006662 [Penicillium angulare]KAJ5281290.1 hypothetical protein N7478_006662 [Penicillium angulare]